MRTFSAILLALLALAFVTSARAATVNAASTSSADVQAAIDAANAGDTVVIPAGSSTWSETVSVPRGKAVNLQGNGVGSTVITRSDNTSAATLRVSIEDGDYVEISGLEFTANSSNPSSSGLVQIDGGTSNAPKFRFYDSKITFGGVRGLRIANTYGLVHDVTIVANAHGQWISLWRSSDTNVWNTASDLGSQLATVVEDCVFYSNVGGIGDGALDAYDNTKFVFRYNTITNTFMGWHGADSGDFPRAPRQWEVYENTFVNTGGNTIYTGVRVRGGTGVIYNNRFTGNWGSPAWLSHYSADPAYNRSGWGPTTGSNPADGNLDEFGYPALDQVGRGQFLNSTWYDASITSYLGREGDYQQLDPAYVWGNTDDGTPRDPYITGPTQSKNFIKVGRDVYYSPKPNYTPLAYPHPLRSVSNAGNIRLSTTGYSVDEDGGTVTIAAERINGASGAVGVSYASSDDTALAGTDYTAVSSTLSWGDGDAADKTFTVTITDRSGNQGERAFDITFSSPTGGATLAAPTVAAVTINETDDVTGPVISSFTNSTPTTSTVTISWTTDEAADAVVDYGTTTAFGSQTTNGVLQTSHSIPITGLSASTTYYYRATSVDAFNNSTTSSVTNSFTTATVSPGSIYVATTGNDTTGDGSIGNPWLTIAKGVSEMTAGDTLYIRTGQYQEPQTWTLVGTEANPYTITAYESEEVIMYGSGVDGGRVKFEDSEWCVFKNIIISNMNQGLFVTDSDNITVDGVTVTYVGQEAFHIHDNSSYVTLTNCIANTTGQWGGASNGEGVYIGTGSAGPVDNTHDVYVYNSFLYDIDDEGVELKPGTYDCIFHGNTISNNIGGFSFGVEINERDLGVQSWTDNPQHTVTANFITGFTTGIRHGTGAVVANNIIENATTGIALLNNDSDVFERLVWHNTINVSTQANGITITGSPTYSIESNIGTDLGSNNLEFDSAYFRNPSNGDYSLVLGAAPIGYSGVVTLPLNTDFTGALRVEPYAAGAYEQRGTESANATVSGAIRF